MFGAQLDHSALITASHALLKVLEAHLDGRNWLATSQPTIADLANYTYIAHAPEGGVSLEDYPNIRHWIARIENLSGFVAMQATAVGLAA
ncbi:glutathione binding-like protein [Spongiibacter sp.]|uniref:glutathione binding-like protein n=1 Tax=Spongiibacter sp. TaxID=2024860 RepID=UPI003561D2C5